MWVEGVNIKTMFYSVPDPDFEIGGGGEGAVIQTLI